VLAHTTPAEYLKIGHATAVMHIQAIQSTEISVMVGSDTHTSASKYVTVSQIVTITTSNYLSSLAARPLPP
jgi:hypothetical protein